MKAIMEWMDMILWLLFAGHVGYLLFFAWQGGMLKPWRSTQKCTKTRRFAVLFPAYKEDRVIVSSVVSFLEQRYPKEAYEVVVLSDRMQEQTEAELSKLPITLLKVQFENSSKAKSLTFAMERLDAQRFDAVVVLDADNTVEADFLERLNEVFETGVKAVQAHRQAKNRNTPIALLDAVSEEINNTIFRAGHVRSGLSSALIGSGMAFDYQWFRSNIAKATTAGEDKELEALLLKQNIYIHYLSEVPVFDEKTQQEVAFGNQRRRWLAAQFGVLAQSLKDFPAALRAWNLDYMDKLVQWMMLPRLVVLAGILFWGTLFTFIEPAWGIKWAFILWLLGLALAMGIPDYLVGKELGKAIRRLPLLAMRMVLNLFRLRGVNKKFIHTEHSV